MRTASGFIISTCCIVGLTPPFLLRNLGKGGVDKYTPRGYIESMKQGIKKKAVRRLKIVEGQVRGLQRMVEEEKYCIDIINQSLAIKEALSSVEDFILENHLSTHVVEQMKSGQEAKAIKEILSVYKVSKRK